MPWDHVMGKFRGGNLHSGSKSGPKVTNPKQAVAIMYSEKKAAQGGKEEYQSGADDKESPALKGLKSAHKK
jgi:hypothetical protein